MSPQRSVVIYFKVRELVLFTILERPRIVKDRLWGYSGGMAFVAQRIEHLTTDQKVGGSSPSKRTYLT
jgi:hypothetical protein